MSNFFVSPFLFWAGLIAVASPIIIHILNKRRFRRVDWAAMDFLLQANKINRRRVKLEDFILLLLRCLVMALLGFLLARPFFTFDSGAGLFKSARHERVILLDDSVSMNAQSNGTTALTEAGKAITNWITALASQDSSDSFTFVLTSRPERALYRDEPLTEDGVNQILEDLKNLETSDLPNQLPKALEEIEEMLDPANGGTSVNRIVYVLSDFRSRDWSPNAQRDLIDSVRRVADQSAGCYLVDTGTGTSGDNLAVESITPRDKALIAGVPSEFEVAVRNHGTAAVTDLKVRLSADEGLPIERVIDRIGPGELGGASFTYTFARPEDLSAIEPVRLQADIAPDSGDGLGEDNVRYFPARVTSGLKVLVIDGNPSSAYGESDSFFLQKALSPRGRSISGLELTVTDDTSLSEWQFGEFQVIYLTNVYRLEEGVRQRLSAWVEDGGGLVVVLGDRIDEESYNTDLYQDGKGMLPVQLGKVAGDDEAETWRDVQLVEESHPTLTLFSGDSNPLLANVKIFQWWDTTIPKEKLDEGSVSVLANIGDDTSTAPLLVESAWGEGRLLTVTTALDLDWNNWPMEAASYLIMLQEITRYLATKRSTAGDLLAGEPLTQDLELTSFRPDATIGTPTSGSLPVRARPVTAGAETATWQIDFEDTSRRGFYELTLTDTDSNELPVLFAANLDPAESQLDRVTPDTLKSALGEAPVKFVTAGTAVMDLGATKSRSEYWRWALYLLLAFLCIELFYGYWLGARR